jgi:hypothetical protein
MNWHSFKSDKRRQMKSHSLKYDRVWIVRQSDISPMQAITEHAPH